MTNEPRSIAPNADPLGEALHLLQFSGTLYCRAELTAPWGVSMPLLDDCMVFHIVTAGQCWLEVEGEEPRLLEQGSLTLLPHSTAHTFRSAAGVPTTPLFDIPVEALSDRYELMRHGGGGDVVRLTCGVVQFDNVAASRLIAQLPRVLHISSWDDESASWLQSTLRFIAREALSLQPGGETVITRLVDILVIQAIRSWLDGAPEAREGWLAALRDEHVGKAIAAIHRAPAEAWTVESLASITRLSRSAFSARFSELVGESAMQYVTNWRMQLARVHLQQSDEPLSLVALRFGYQSDAAFCRAFKRTFGVSPGALRVPVAA